MTLRPEVVRERLRKLREIIAQLAPLRSVPREDFIADYRHYWLVERGLQLAAESLFDVGNHVLAGIFHSSPETYEEIPKKLAEKGAITEELRQRLRGLGGFRNILVHDYLEVDHHQLYDFLQSGLPDFEAFAEQIESFLEHRGGTG